MRVAVVDYGSGNLTSVTGALRHLGVEPVLSSDPLVLSSAEKIILPGVGAFGDCIRNLRQTGLDRFLEQVKDKVPILGICVGAQMMCRESDEFGRHEGLGWVDAVVRRLEMAPDQSDLRVPHVGWNELHRTRDCPLFVDVPDDALFYYVHSYAMQPCMADLAVATCDYGSRFMASFQAGMVYGVQFHPEKSQQHGLTVLRNFVERG